LVILTELTDGVFHPVRFEILRVLKNQGLDIEEIRAELIKGGTELTKTEVTNHVATLLAYGLIADVGWKTKGNRSKTFTLSKGLSKALSKAKEMIAQLE